VRAKKLEKMGNIASVHHYCERETSNIDQIKTPESECYPAKYQKSNQKIRAHSQE